MVVVNARGGTQAVYYDPSAPAITATLGGTMATFYDPSEPTVKVKTGETIAVYFDPATPSVAATFSGSMATYFDPAEPTIKGITNTIRIGDIPGTVAVYFSPSNPAVNATFSAASLEVVPSTGSRIMYDEGYQAQRVLVVGSQAAASLQVTGITNSIETYLSATAGTLGVRVGQIDDTVMVMFSPSSPAVAANFSGSISAVPETGQGEPLYDESKNAHVVMQKAGETFAVYFDPASPSVNASFSAASLEVVPSTGSRIMYDESYQAQRVLIVGSQNAASLQIVGITNSIGVHLLSTGGTLGVDVGKISDTVAIWLTGTSGTQIVMLDRESVLSGIQSTVQVNVGTIADSVKVFLDPGYEIGSIKSINTTSQVNVGTVEDTITVRLDPGYELGSIKGINSSVATYLGATAGTLAVKIDPGYNVVNASSTIIIPSYATGSYAGVSDLGKTLASPIASSNIKVFAYSIITTGVVSTLAKFTNGAGAATELWRALATPAASASETRGSNVMVTPPAYIFATGSNVTLALHTGNASLVHYSIGYFRESA